MVELVNPVKYHLHQNAPLPSVTWLYDYVIAADGVYKRAENDFMAALIPVAKIAHSRKSPPIAGLNHCDLPRFTLKTPKLPASALAYIIESARVHWIDYNRFIENYYIINDKGVPLRPTQKGTGASVSYEFGPIAMQSSHTYVIDIHTHPSHAFFSETDDRDEQGFKLYGVLGHLRRKKPQFCLRLGVYGNFMTLAADEVFEAGVYGLIEDDVL